MKAVIDDLYLDWTEKELPQAERTKHVHGMHPYLGKFIPQLPEIFLEMFFKKGETILDPFVGSGTTLVVANSFGMNSIGLDISAFNCLLTKVKTDEYELLKLKHELNNVLSKVESSFQDQMDLFNESNNAHLRTNNEYINTWYSEKSIQELLMYKRALQAQEYKYKDVMKIILSRSARSARQVPHYELDWPKEPVKEPYYCHKHKRTCYPTDGALKFLRRYTTNTFNRIKEFSKLRSSADVTIMHTDSRDAKIDKLVDGIFTSPPYCGLIDYHLQHEYAYNLLELKDLSSQEIGPKSNGQSKQAIEDYKQGMIDVFRNCNRFLKRDGKVIIVVNDRFEIYPEIIEKSSMKIQQIVDREVNRRTGRRATNFTENIIICKPV